MRFCLAALVLVPFTSARGGDTPEAFTEDTLKALQDIQPILAGIKDVKTAEAARPKLLEIQKRLMRLEERAIALGKDPEQKKRLVELAKKYQAKGEDAAEELVRELRRIRGLPGALKALGDLPLLQLAALGNARRARAQVDVRTLTTAVEAYFIKNADYPNSLAELTRKQPDGGRPFLEPKSLLDPWGRPYGYDPGTRDHATGRPLIYSQGPRPGDLAGRIRNWPDTKK
jgi:hypothetical protein